MGVLESRCPECGKRVQVVFHDRSLETLLIERTCGCRAIVSPPAIQD